MLNKQLYEQIIWEVARIVKSKLMEQDDIETKTTITADVKFPEFKKEEFVKDFESWKSINHMNVMGRPKKPAKPIFRKSFDEQLKDIPVAPIRPLKPSSEREPMPEKPKDNREYYTAGEEKKKLERMMCPRPKKPLSEYKYEGKHIDYRLLRDFDYHFKNYLIAGPEALLDEYTKILKSIRNWEPEDSFYIIKELSDYYKELKKFVDNKDKYIQKYADKIYQKELDDYERKLAEWKEDTPEKRLQEYELEMEKYQQDLKTYEKQKEEFRLNNRGNTDIELYLDALQAYEDKMYQYREKMVKWGPNRELTVDDFLILMFVRPEIGGNSVFLKDGTEYKFPEYVRGVRVSDLKNVNGWGDHLESYRKFLKMNPNISKETPGKYEIRSTDSKWTFNNFIKTWVLNYYTDLYENLEIIEY